MIKYHLLWLFIFSSFHSYSQFPTDVYLEEWATGITLPTEIINAGDDRIFVCEKTGVIKIIGADGQVLPEAFLDISDKVASDHEQGLLGMAFHPDFTNNGWFYINYTDEDFHNNIVRLEIDASNPNKANRDSEKLILKIDECAFTLHHGGCLRFGPEGYLFIAVGDCGFSNEAQELDSFLGKLLRIDVDNGDPYSIPTDNPMYNTTFPQEIWAMGLRNPWKFSFDYDNRNLWIGDVGYQTYEEIDFTTADNTSLPNFGWPCYEGTEEDQIGFSICDEVDIQDLIFPLGGYNYDSCLSCGGSITGGYVYKGTSELLQNTEAYIYGDYCNGKLYSTYLQDGQYETVEIYDNNFVLDNISTFGENNLGQLLVADIVKGTIYKIHLDCRLPDIEVKVASCSLSEDGCVEIITPSNGGILSTTLKDGNDIIIPESEYCNLTPGIYILETVNMDSQCSMQTTFEVEVFEPRIDIIRASCSIVEDGNVDICISQAVSDDFGYYIESDGGDLIDPISYSNLLPGYYNMIMDNSSPACMDTFDFYIPFDQDFFPVSLTNGVLMVEDNYESYQWFISDTFSFNYGDYRIIENAIEPSYTPLESGFYLVRATDVDGCEHYRRRNGELMISSIDQVLVNKKISLSPNPVIDELIISFDCMTEQKILLTVYNISGKKVFSEEIDGVNESHNHSLSTADLEAGTYMISITSNSCNASSIFIKE